MTPKSIRFVMLLLAFLCIQLIDLNLCRGVSTSGCIQSERNALLDFKQGLKDQTNRQTNRLSSWTGEDCCNWEGVACNNKTGHVVQLDLRNPHPFADTGDLPYNRWSLGGKISPSLLGLKHLNYLDLSMNNFGGSRIPEFFGSFSSLRYLNLSRAGLGGSIPHQLGNLSTLRYLDLYNDLDPNFIVPVGEFSIDDALWISGLSSLQHLNMKNVKFQKVANWVQALNMLPSVVEICLSLCDIDSISLSLPHVNFTHLSTLDLSFNFINSTIPFWLFNISSLGYVDLSSNFFRGSIPAAIENLTSLNVLDLSNNKLEGGIPRELGSLCELHTLELSGANISRGLPELGEVFSGCIKTSIQNLGLMGNQLTGYLPDWLGELRMLKTLYLTDNSLFGSVPVSLGRLSSLQELSLSNNKLNGTIPESLGWLSGLVNLDVGSNLLEGVISEVHFANLTRLQYLDLSSNHLVLMVSPDWVPPFQLDTIKMGSCKLGPRFPAWLRTQANVSFLDMSNAGILDTLPDWFWSLFSQSLDTWPPDLDISGNGITGKMPSLSNLINFSTFDLSSNYFEGPLPNLSSSVEALDLSNNSFSGPIHPGIGKSMPNLIYLSLSRNKLSGHIPPSLCQLEDLAALDLSRNLLSGELPNCWKLSSGEHSITALDFGSNNLSGGIPETIGSISSLESLHLSNNNLSGELPSSLRRCTSLITLDLGQNKFKGRIPTWIGESCVTLKILRLRSNMFVGNIPPSLSRLSGLQVLDLGKNNLSGSIPQSFGNFTAMKVTRPTIGLVLFGFVSSYEENLLVKIKGSDLEYDELLSLVIIMDLSDNNISGKIPEELGSLSGLLSLNLSGNHLTGEIPEKIGLLLQLESLDLSRNELSGAIPSTMSSLTSLIYLDLSYNNLSGRIPSGNQLQTITNQSTYIGNPGLCGFPLAQKCPGDDTNQTPMAPGENREVKDDAGSEMWGLYVSMGPGFVVGFWAVVGTLLLKKNWKDAYFRYVDNMYDWVYVIIAVNWNRFKKN